MAGKEISGPAFLCGVVVGLPSYMTEPFRKSGLRFRICQSESNPGSLAIFPSWGLYIIRQPYTVSKRAGVDILIFLVI